MEKPLIEIFNILAVCAIFIIPFLKRKGSDIIVPFLITFQVIISYILAFSVMHSGP
jgi:hypothetical protein